MKKAISILSLALIIAASGCGNSDSRSVKSGPGTGPSLDTAAPSANNTPAMRADTNRTDTIK